MNLELRDGVGMVKQESKYPLTNLSTMNISGFFSWRDFRNSLIGLEKHRLAKKKHIFRFARSFVTG